MQTVFITGITGLLGTNLVLDLLEEQFRVKALLRNLNAYHEVNHSNLQLIQGGLFENIEKHLESVDVFVHIAAETKQNITQYDHYRNVNLEATKHLFQSCAKCGVKKFIYISTANTVGYGSLSEPGNEKHQMREPFTHSMYAQSKLDAEKFLLSQAGKIETIILNPTFMIGAYDSKPSSGRIILMGWKKRFIFYPGGGKNFVHVKDVARAIINSIQFGKHGEKYLLANENLTYKAFFERLNRIANQTPTMIKVPDILLIILGYLGDALRNAGFKTGISSTTMKSLRISNYFSNLKSIEELGINYRSIDFAIREAIDYFEKQAQKQLHK